MASRLPTSLNCETGSRFCLEILHSAVLTLLLLLASFQCLGQEGSVSKSGKYSSPSPPSTNTAANTTALETLKQRLDIVQVSPDIVRVGRVILNRHERAVRIPCHVNMRRYAVEYVLVTETGKRHESVLVTDAKPEQIHIACLLLGIAATNFPGDYNQPCPVPPANAVDIEASWTREGALFTCGLDKLVVIREESVPGNNQTPPSSPSADKPLTPGNWFYNGSFFGPNSFQAQVEGSIVSLIRDSAALINNPRPDLDNDRIHFPNEGILPPDGTAVDVVLRFGSR